VHSLTFKTKHFITAVKYPAAVPTVRAHWP
jgi:hypothetical protein